MAVNIDDLIQQENIVIQRKITRYDVNWGRPVNALTYKRLILSADPAYYWKLEDSDGETVNIGYKGTSFNSVYTPSSGITFADGVIDPSDTYGIFDGTGYGLPGTAAADSEATSLSISAWVYLTTDVTGGDRCIVSRGNSFGTATYPYALVITDANAIDNEVLFYGNNGEEFSGGSISLNTWHHIVVTIKPNSGGADYTLKIFIDGEEEFSDATAVNCDPQPSNAQKIYLGAYYTGGVLTTASRFNRRLDEVSIFYKPLSADLIKKIYSVGITSSFIEPDEDFDNDVLGVVYDSTDYPTLITEDNPLHYWPCDTTNVTAGPTYKSPDLGVEDLLKRNDLVQTGYCTTNSAPSMITGYGNPAGASEPYSNNEGNGIFGTSRGDSTDNLQLGTAGNYVAHTVEFWLKLTNHGDQQDGLLGFSSCKSLGEGYAFYHMNGFLKCDICSPDPDGIINNGNLNDDGDYVINGKRVEIITFARKSGTNVFGSTFNSEDKILKNQVYYVALTVDTNGVATAYINGKAIASKQLAGARGVRVPATTSRFRVGQPVGYQDSSAWYLDELAMYTRALRPSSILRHYQVGIYGPSYRTSYVNDDPTQAGSPYSLSQNEYSTLENEEDITGYISSYSIDSDIKQIVDTCTLTVFEEWDSVSIEDKLKANSYVKIQERYTSSDESYDSGWVDRGTFLSEGKVSKSIVGSGGKSYSVALRNTLKLLGFEPCHTYIEPDKLFVPKRLLDNVETFPDYKEFKIQHDVVQGAFYQNWAESPSVKLWVTDLQNYNDGDKGGVNDPKEQLRIRGGQDAVRVLGGEGAVQIDLNFFGDKISENGLGNPSTLYVELYRYADPYDVESNIQITDIYHRDRWYISTSRLSMFADNKTMFVKTGDAKGKMFKIRQYGAINSAGSVVNVGDWTAGSNVALAGSTLGNWSNPGNAADSNDLTTASISGSLDFSLSETKTTNYLKLSTFVEHDGASLSEFSDSASVRGIEVAIRHRTDIGNHDMSHEKRPIRDNIVRLSLDGTQEGTYYSDDKASTTPWTDLDYDGGPTPANFQTFIYGGETDNWGFDTLTVGELEGLLGDMAFFISAKSVTDGTGISGSQSFTIEIESITIKFYIEDRQSIHIVDMNGLSISPEQEGIAVGDTIQIGDFNSVEDALRKVLIKNGFQENDSSLPFYFELDPCPKNIAPSVVPIRYNIEDEVPWMDVVAEIMEFAPPDYRLYQDASGVVRGTLTGLLALREPTHVVEAIVDINEDSTDYGIVNRVIVRGKGGVSVNVALNVDSGGSSAVHAYKLDHFASNLKDLNGRILDQSDANAVWQEVFDGNAKKPIPPGTTWNTGSPSVNRHYGVLYNRYGKLIDVKRWDFEDEDLCALDIGKTGTATPIEIDAIDITWFNHYLEGNSLKQTLSIYYMTEADYEAEYSQPCPDVPDQTDTSYFPDKNARSWRLLVDQIQLDDGNNLIEYGDFETEKPCRTRFLKFRNEQCHHRFPVIGKDDSRVYSRITLADIKVYNSRNIMATAELGVSDPFASGAHKALMSRLRRRTDVLEENFYLDTYEKAQDFALTQLQERYIDFSPFSATVFAPTVDVGEYIRIRHPETGDEDNYLVTAVTHESNGSSKVQLLNYSINI